jgi:hypothetical protein
LEKGLAFFLVSLLVSDRQGQEIMNVKRRNQIGGMTMIRFISRLRGFALLMLGSLVFTGFAYGDEVTEAINEALQSYKEGKFSEAMTGLNYASQLIGQKKGGDLQSFLPKPLDGWEASEATSQASGAAMLGGGVSAKAGITKTPHPLRFRSSRTLRCFKA